MQNFDHRIDDKCDTDHCFKIWYLKIYGPESSGKTTLALHAIAEVQVIFLVDPLIRSLFHICMLLKYNFLTVQKLGGNAMLVDAEHAFDPAYSKALGVDVENLIVCQPDNGEMALESNPTF